MKKLVDAHVHVTQELLPYLRKVSCIANAQNEAEFEFLQSFRTEDMILSAGVHPWDAERSDLRQMENVLLRADVIGEIGMDSVWCDCDLAVQELLFIRQLELAQQMKKPVILHTKGQERRIAEIIRRYPNRYLVHWYSASDGMQAYRDMDAYFTVGPNFRTDAQVRRVVMQVPMDRLLPESDGLDGLSWALEQRVTAVQYRDTMDGLLRDLAQLRGIDPMTLAARMEQNLLTFLQT